MSVKDVRPGEPDDKRPQKKQVRDIGSSGLDELVQRVQHKLEQKLATAEPVTQADKPATPSELKKQYFNKVGVEKNMDTTAARALRGNMLAPAGAGNDARNLKI